METRIGMVLQIILGYQDKDGHGTQIDLFDVNTLYSE